MTRTITEPLRSPTDDSTAPPPPPPLQPPGHSTSRWAGAAEFLIGSTLATLVGVLWVEAGSAPYSDLCTDGQQCWGFTAYSLVVALVAAFAYPALSVASAAMLSRLEARMLKRTRSTALHRRSSLALARVLLHRTSTLCAGIANSTFCYYLLADLHAALSVNATVVDDDDDRRYLLDDGGFGSRRLQHVPPHGGGGGRPGGGGFAPAGRWRPSHGGSVVPGPSAEVGRDSAVPLLVLADLAVAVGMTLVAALVTWAISRRGGGGGGGGPSEPPHSYRAVLAASVDASFVTALGYVWNVFFSDALLVPLLHFVLRSDAEAAAVQLGRAALLLLLCPPLYLRCLERADVAARRVSFRRQLHRHAHDATLAMVSAALSMAVYTCSQTLASEAAGLLVAFGVAVAATAASVAFGWWTAWRPSSKAGAYALLQAQWHVNFLFWYPTDALLDLVPGEGVARLATLLPLALLATALVSCAAGGLQRAVDGAGGGGGAGEGGAGGGGGVGSCQAAALEAPLTPAGAGAGAGAWQR